MSVKRYVKSILQRDSLAFKIARTVYRILHPGLIWSEWKFNRFRRKCYAKFEESKIVTLTHADMECYYEAISPKNYWHLSRKNSENHDYFGRFLKSGDIVLDIGGHVGAWTVP